MRYRVTYTKRTPDGKPSVHSETINFPVIYENEPSRGEVAEEVRKHSGGNFIEETIKFEPDRF